QVRTAQDQALAPDLVEGQKARQRPQHWGNSSGEDSSQPSRASGGDDEWALSSSYILEVFLKWRRTIEDTIRNISDVKLSNYIMASLTFYCSILISNVTNPK
ncbi:MAG: hypothetical protein ACRCW3_02645, partial [Metamycoplasmataceae bacterium]